jgi:hypothetical protein
MKKFLSIFIALVLVTAFLNVRYPQFTTWEAVHYVYNRYIYKKIIREIYEYFAKYEKREPIEIELANVRNIILERLPDIERLDSSEKAIALSTLIHNEVKIEPVTGMDFTNIDRIVYKALDGDGHLCQGLAFIYIITLKAFQIESRYVGLFEKTASEGILNSHATVDVWINGRWVAIDPTFNMTLRDSSGDFISWEQAREIYLSGGSFEFRDEGAKPGRTLPEYYSTHGGIGEFLRVLNYAVFSLAHDGTKILPPGWDGKIYLPDHVMTINPADGIYAEFAR